MSFSGTIASDFMKLAHIPLQKRPSLINFTDNDFLSLRNSLINYAQTVYPLEYQYFVESDLGMMFIELVAYMGSVMSMKADMLANENFLSTAKNRSSVKKLLQLIGVRMRGPLSAAANAQLTCDTPVATDVQFDPNSRVINSNSPEDGGAVSYTLYKVVNGLVEEANKTGNIILYNAEGQGTPVTVFKNIVLQEGALVTDEGEFASTEAVKTVKLSEGPVIEGSVQVNITSTDSAVDGAYTEVDNIYFASGSSDKIFEVVYNDAYNATIIFGDGSVGISPDDTAS